jgi:multidrug efflux pump
MQQNGLQTYITIERATAQRYGFAPNQIDAVLYDAYGQRTVTTIFNPFNQYYVVMEVAPPYWQFPQMLDRTYLSTAAGNASGSAQTQMQGGTVSGVPAYSAISAGSTAAASSNSLNANAQANAVTNSIANSRGGSSTGSADSTAAETMVPLPAMTTYSNNHTATQVNHQNGLVASTISFNLPPGGSLSRAQAAITQAMHDLGMPASIRGSPAGAGQVFAQNMVALPLLLLAAFGAIYIVLGILYENTIHPITILSTLPSAIIGAILALLIFGTPLSVIAFIGVILLIGIVKKNAIMMIDVALHLQRNENKEPQDAIHDAAVIRLRPIMMTTAAAVLGALPLAIGIGQGASLRQPLGITVIGGLILSQVFTLYTTPVIYLGFERLRIWLRKRFAGAGPQSGNVSMGISS